MSEVASWVLTVYCLGTLAFLCHRHLVRDAYRRGKVDGINDLGDRLKDQYDRRKTP